MKYTVSREDLIKLRKIRNEQVQEFRQAQSDRPPLQWRNDPANQADVARLILVNGNTTEGVVHVDRLSQWARWVHVVGDLSLEIGDRVLHITGVNNNRTESELNITIAPDAFISGKGYAPAARFGPPIVLAAPAKGGKFEIRDETAVPAPALSDEQLLEMLEKGEGAQ